MITKERIIEAATQLFVDHGVRSVTIDKIVKDLHTSKRTLYNHFDDKTQLLKAVLSVYHQKIKKENESTIKNSRNAIEAMANLYQHIVHRSEMVNPNFFSDIVHYYPGLLEASYRETNNFAHEQLKYIAEWGMEDGIFLEDMDIQVTAKTVLELLKLLKDKRKFPMRHFNRPRLTFGIMIPYLRGLCTKKGLKMVDKYAEYFKVTI